MRSQRDMRLEELFQLVSELGPDERADFFARHCDDDPELRSELDALLAQDDEGTRDYLESPVLTGGVDPRTPLADDAELNRPMTQVGPYRLLEKIGEGGMGVVYLAEQEEPLKRRVALKIVKPGMDTPRVLLRFETERAALARLQHAGVARIYDAGALESGRPYFVMEYIHGEPITTFCDRERLSIDHRLRLFTRVCDAVQHAHRKGVIHRDLKPQNVLVALEGEDVVPKVIDFGVAVATSGAMTEGAPGPAAPDVVGTRLYMSPEQADPDGDGVDTRTDVYSLGALLHELLVGEPPFPRDAFEERPMLDVLRAGLPAAPSRRVLADGEQVAAIARSRGTTPGPLRARLAGDLDAIVARAMAPDAEARYGTVAELAADVQRHLSLDLVVARNTGPLERASRAVRRNRALSVLVAAVAIVLVVGVALVVRSERQAREERQTAVDVTRFLAEALAPVFETQTPTTAAARLSTLQQIRTRLKDEALADQPMAEVQVRQALGRSYHELGELDLAAGQLRQALQTLVDLGATSPAQRFPVESALALVYLDSDERDASDLFYVSEVSLVRSVRERLPDVAFRLAEVMNVLDSDAWDQLPERLRALEAVTRERVDSADPTWLLVANLLASEGVWAGWVGQHHEALLLATEALAIRRQELPATHVDLARSMEQVGGLLLQTGQPEGAQAILEAALHIHAKRLVDDHWLVARVRSLLGESLLLQGERDAARPHLLFGFERLLQSRGPHNQDTAAAAGRLVRLLEGEGDPAATSLAREQFAECMAFAPNTARHWDRQGAAFGPELSPLVATVERIETLLQNEQDEDDLDDDQRQLQLRDALDELDTRWELLSPDHEAQRVILARTLKEWSFSIPMRFDDELARVLYRAAAVLESHADTLAFDLGETLEHLGELALQARNLDDAGSLLRRGAGLLERSAGPWALTSQRAQLALARYEALLGDADAGLRRARREQQTCRNWYGTGDWSYARTIQVLVDLLRDDGRLGEAVTLLEHELAAGVQSGLASRSLLNIAWMTVSVDGLPTALYALADSAGQMCQQGGIEDEQLALVLAAAQMRTGRSAQALANLDAALAAGLMPPGTLAACHAIRALGAHALGDRDLRVHAQQSLREHAEPSGDPLGSFEGTLVDEALALTD
jgi:serine/threonine protein kinase/tetratricopeptide (TPR) repeat protein